MKRLSAYFASVVCLMMLSLPAHAHDLTVAIATPDCDSQTIKLSFEGINMELAPVVYRVNYTITLTPTDGGPAISPISGFFEGTTTEIDPTDTQDLNGIFSVMVTENVPALAGRSVLVGGSATLFQPLSRQRNTLPLTNEAGATNFEVNCTEPPTASLGDRVWEDLNRNGIQDCENTDGDPRLGSAGDEGEECSNAGIDGVPVYLLDGDCSTPLGQMEMTAGGGFYSFDNLQPGDYCVEFGLPPDDFCDTGIYELGSPKFTAQNAGDDAADSDADTATGVSDPTNLSAGETDRTIDAGVYCPAKIGDQVFLDENENGIQDGDDPVSGVTVTLFECGPDMIAGTADDIPTGETRTTGADGMYMFGAEPDYELPPGKYYVQFDLPPGLEFTTPGVGPDNLDSDCAPPDGNTTCTDLTASRAINLDRDCGLVPPPPPECNLLLDKTCRVEEPPAPPATGKCDGRLQQFTVIWNGAGPISVSGVPNDAGATVNPGDEVTFFGPFPDNDVEVNLSGSGYDGTQSTFHTSCSDEDFNDPSDCGKVAGDGKGQSGFINQWLLEGFVDKEGVVLDCTADPSTGGFTDDCRFEQEPLPSCDNGEKPQTLTWRYDGGTGGDGDCADSTFFTIVNADGKPHLDFECTGSVDTGLPITVVDDDNVSYSVNPGDSFTVPLDSNKALTLTDSNGATQDLVFHTSCSQPLEAQATAGAITLVGLDNRTGGREVTYQYEVSNFGDALTGVSVDDVPLGNIVSGDTLASGETKTYQTTAFLLGTTTNTATASGMLATGAVCSPDTATDTVTVTSFIPPCSLTVVLDKVEDDKLKLKVTNTDTRDRRITIESLTVSFPAAREHVKEMKLDGDFYKRDQASPTVDGTPASFGAADWTNDDIKNRQVKPGDTKTLEIVTTKKSDKNGRFEVEVVFAEGCSFTVVVENQQILP